MAWTLLEWLTHRAMHLRLRSERLARWQYEAHLRHHDEPHDLDHAVVRLRASVPLAAVLFVAAWVCFAEPSRAALFHAGLLIGYLAYETVHLVSHGRGRPPGFAYLTRYHAVHHYQDIYRAYGVTSPLWDWLFGTLPAMRT